MSYILFEEMSDQDQQALKKKYLTFTKPTQREIFDIDTESGGLRPPTHPEQKSVLVEGKFKFFEIENFLRQLCHDQFEPLRQQLLRDAQTAKQTSKSLSEVRGQLTQLQESYKKLDTQVTRFRDVNSDLKHVKSTQADHLMQVT